MGKGSQLSRNVSDHSKTNLMNTNLQKKFLRMSRLTLYALVLSTSLSLGATHLSKAQDKQLRDVTLTLSSEEDRLVPLFGEIGQLSGFRFAYSPEEIGLTDR